MTNQLIMPSENHDRQRRLAEALRANLRRRKGQTRERTHEEAREDEVPEPGPAVQDQIPD